MRLEEAPRMIMLHDFYGGLLTDRQQKIVASYYGDDMSLSEIAEEMGISRQGVHDALRKAAAALEEYEAKLRLLGKFRSAEAAVDAVKRELDGLIGEAGGHEAFRARLSAVRNIIEDLEI
ncbi:MAG: hypothetical protein LBG71_05030 [Clostridiales Family XIII bacterium]|jgi:predicted DNA-binding protein YlxM (UPF0122 family)|nr:hypothetical protein [Clostridiales Family XIII bacterium]